MLKVFAAKPSLPRYAPDAESGIDWFDDSFQTALGRRYETFRMAFGAILKQRPRDFVIVETGCVREKNDYSAGYSSVLFGEFLRRNGGHLWSVDIDAAHMKLCRKFTKQYAATTTYIVNDSVDFLKNWSRQSEQLIDLLYLDSWDYPSDGSAADQRASQEHCLKELQAALPSLSPNAVVLIDDGDLPGGGKPGLTLAYMRELGWECLLDSYQKLWRKL